MLDANGEIVDANPGVYALFGSSPGEMIGTSVKDVVCSARDDFLETFKEQVDTNGRFYEELLGMRKDGGTFEMAGGEVKLMVSNDTDGDYVVADAIRWKRARGSGQAESR